MLIEQTGNEIHDPSHPSTDEIRAELNAILASSAFRKSERQAQFLRFVCETALRREASTLNEYVIAYQVFGRGNDYSPAADSVVRRQAHSLRQKITEYYADEGRNHAVRIQLPVGRYVPQFSRHGLQVQVVQTSEPQIGADQPSGRVHHPTRQYWPLFLAAICLALGFGLGLLTTKRTNQQRLEPALEDIWKSWLGEPDGALICLSNPLTTVVKHFPFPLVSDAPASPPRISLTDSQSQQLHSYFGLPFSEHLYLYPTRSQSKTGEALGVVALSSLLTKAGTPVRASQSEFLSWEDFRSQNIVLLGHDESNRWLDPILYKLPIKMATTNGEKARRIYETEPKGGVPVEYYPGIADESSGASVDYALVSMLDGVDGRHQLLLVNGLRTEGTQIAMEYLCNPRTAAFLLRELQKAVPGHKGNWRFQMVLRTVVRNGVPTEAHPSLVKVLR